MMDCGYRFVAWSILLLTIAVAGCDDSNEDEGAQQARGDRGSEPSSAAGFEWTREPKLAAVPEGPVRGRANGSELRVESVVFEPRFGGWALLLSDTELEEPTAIPPPGAQVLTITDLPQPMGPGVHRRAMSKVGGSYWQLRDRDGGQSTTSWTAPHAYVLQITKWSVQPWRAEQGLFQQAGRASGRIAVVYEGQGDFDDAWVAGKFEDAVVRYMGKPQWASP